MKIWLIAITSALIIAIGILLFLSGLINSEPQGIDLRENSGAIGLNLIDQPSQAVSCEAFKSVSPRSIKKQYGACTAHKDCTYINESLCPFGCYTATNIENIDAMRSAMRKYIAGLRKYCGQDCKYKCQKIDAVELMCIEGQCQIVN